MSKAAGPDLKKYMDKSLLIKINGNRRVDGVLRGFDQFMNLVLDDAHEELADGKKVLRRPLGDQPYQLFSQAVLFGGGE